jgi:mannose-6-phosphate isomerase-like protein (cupin superfamily)
MSDMKCDWKKQKVAISHLAEDSFKSGTGLRSFNIHRDLGVIAATDGMVKVHVVRAAQPCEKGNTGGRHIHNVDFQFVYMLKGWQTMWLEGEGVVTMREGSSWTQPPGLRHEVLDYSDDREVIEIILPAKFDTIDA